jgi:hypothetical protein
MADIDQLASLLADAWRPSRTMGIPSQVEDYRSLLQALDARVQRLGRTVARNKFNTLADSNDITVVTNHDNTQDSVVIMRGQLLAGLIEGAVEAAVKKASLRRPLVNRLVGLKSLPSGDDNFRIRPQTGQEHHRVRLRDEETPGS